MTVASAIRSSLRLALAGTSACLGLGLLMWVLVSGPIAEVALALIWTGVGLLLLVPIFNVAAVLLDEWRRDTRVYAWAALAVLALLAWTTVTRFF